MYVVGVRWVEVRQARQAGPERPWSRWESIGRYPGSTGGYCCARAALVGWQVRVTPRMPLAPLASDIWMVLASEVLSMRDATLTLSPSRVNFFRTSPTTPDITAPVCTPTRTARGTPSGCGVGSASA